MDAVLIADDFESTISQLPDADHVSLADEETFKQIREQYDKLTDYQKEYIEKYSKDALDKFTAAETALKALIALRDLINKGDGTNKDDSDKKDDNKTETGDGTEATTPKE